MLINRLIHEISELCQKALVLLEKVYMEVEPHRGSVGVERPGKLLGISHGMALFGEHEATLVVPCVQLVEDHLQQPVPLLRAPLDFVATLVGHAVVERVGPDGDLLKGCHDGAVILEVLKHEMTS